MKHAKYGRGQFGQVIDGATVIGEQLGDGLGRDAEAVDLDAEPSSPFNGIECQVEGVRISVRQDQDEFSRFGERHDLLQCPPERLPQRRAASRAQGEVAVHPFPVSQDRANCGARSFPLPPSLGAPAGKTVTATLMPSMASRALATA